MPDFGFHDWLDAQLRNVPLPSDLLARLSAAGPTQGPADEQLDAALRNVGVPADLQERLRRIARPRYLPTPAWRRFALAASVFVALGLAAGGYVGLISGLLVPAPTTVASKPPGEALRSGDQSPQRGSDAPARGQDSVAAISGSQDKPQADAVAPARHPADDQAPAKSRAKQVAGRAAGLGLPTYEQIMATASSIRQAAETRSREQAALGAGGGMDRPPELEVLDTLVPRPGIAPPRVKGYDLLFQLKHSEHPFVSPSAHPDLTSSRVPLTLSTASYDLARRAARGGQGIAAGDVRIEDFVAAQDYLLPAPPRSGLALHVAGCASPFGNKGLHVVQVVVQSPASRQPHAASRLVVVVEMSWRMRAAARWEAIERALTKTAISMSDADRVTLVGYSEQPGVLAQDVTPRDLAALVASGKLQPPSGSASLVAGLSGAARATRAPSGGRPTRIVFLAASPAALQDVAPEVAKKSLIDQTGAPVKWQLVSLADPGDSSAQRWVEAAGGKFAVADSAAALHGLLAESLSGRSSTVARDVSLEMKFNPRVVTGYRLLGHEAVTLTGPATEPLKIDLGADQSPTSLFELWIKSTGDEVVAGAELKWRDPDSGQPRRIARAVRRSQLAGTFSQGPAWLQQGVVAAKAAEALRGSYYAKASNPPALVLEVADQVEPRVGQRSDFRNLLTLVEQAAKAH